MRLGTERSSRQRWPCPARQPLVPCSVPSRTLGSQLCPVLPVPPRRHLPPPGWELFLPPRLDWTPLLGRYPQKGKACPAPSPKRRLQLLAPPPTCLLASLSGCSPAMFGANCSQPCQCGPGERCHPETGACVCPPEDSGAPCRIGEVFSRTPPPLSPGHQDPDPSYSRPPYWSPSCA